MDVKAVAWRVGEDVRVAYMGEVRQGIIADLDGKHAGVILAGNHMRLGYQLTELMPVLPEVPVVAAMLARQAIFLGSCGCVDGDGPYADCHRRDADAALAAAWPVLYATALRHAAADLDSRQTADNTHISERDPAMWLHELADRAE